MLLRTRRTPSGFVEPCLPFTAKRPRPAPIGVHEIKHDGYRMMARRDPIGIRLLTRNGHDWSARYPLIVEAMNASTTTVETLPGHGGRDQPKPRAVHRYLREISATACRARSAAFCRVHQFGCSASSYDIPPKSFPAAVLHCPLLNNIGW
jgi:hypothetical protein